MSVTDEHINHRSYIVYLNFLSKPCLTRDGLLSGSMGQVPTDHGSLMKTRFLLVLGPWVMICKCMCDHNWEITVDWNLTKCCPLTNTNQLLINCLVCLVSVFISVFRKHVWFGCSWTTEKCQTRCPFSKIAVQTEGGHRAWNVCCLYSHLIFLTAQQKTKDCVSQITLTHRRSWW